MPFRILRAYITLAIARVKIIAGTYSHYGLYVSAFSCLHSLFNGATKGSLDWDAHKKPVLPEADERNIV